MSFNYSTLANVALSQIADKGRYVELVSRTQGEIDIDTNTITGQTECTSKVKALFTEFQKADIDGDLIKQNDRLVLIAGNGLTEPDTSDILIDNGKNLTVVNIETVKPGDTVLLYKLQVRG